MGRNNSKEFLVPVLQESGPFKQDYAPGTLRQKLFGGIPDVWRKAIHAAAYRFRSAAAGNQAR